MPVVIKKYDDSYLVETMNIWKTVMIKSASNAFTKILIWEGFKGAI